MIMEYRKALLLSRNNHKTIKGEKFGYITYILYMSPYKDNSKGINLCPHASAGCSAACLFGSGMAGLYVNVANGRRNKTEWYLENKAEFMSTLHKEIGKAIDKHKKTDPKTKIVFRLNGTSDIRWEKIPVAGFKNIFEAYPKVQFYDYTKNPLRMDLGIKNYHVTFSRSETNHNQAMKILAAGHNVAMVFKTVPKKYEGFKVINGDLSDLRFKDKKGVIVGLTYKNRTGKGSNNKIAYITGFAISATTAA